VFRDKATGTRHRVLKCFLLTTAMLFTMSTSESRYLKAQSTILNFILPTNLTQPSDGDKKSEPIPRKTLAQVLDLCFQILKF
jgi:hypothetical protein